MAETISESQEITTTISERKDNAKAKAQEAGKNVQKQSWRSPV